MSKRYWPNTFRRDAIRTFQSLDSKDIAVNHFTRGEKFFYNSNNHQIIKKKSDFLCARVHLNRRREAVKRKWLFNNF